MNKMLGFLVIIIGCLGLVHYGFKDMITFVLLILSTTIAMFFLKMVFGLYLDKKRRKRRFKKDLETIFNKKDRIQCLPERLKSMATKLGQNDIEDKKEDILKFLSNDSIYEVRTKVRILKVVSEETKTCIYTKVRFKYNMETGKKIPQKKVTMKFWVHSGTYLIERVEIEGVHSHD